MPKVKFLRGTNMSNAVPQDGAFYLDTNNHNLYHGTSDSIHPIIPTVFSADGFQTIERTSKDQPIISLAENGMSIQQDGSDAAYFEAHVQPTHISILAKAGDDPVYSVASLGSASINMSRATSDGPDPSGSVLTSDVLGFSKNGNAIGQYSGHRITMQTYDKVDAVYDHKYIELFHTSTDVGFNGPIYINADASPSEVQAHYDNYGGTAISNMQINTDTVKVGTVDSTSYNIRTSGDNLVRQRIQNNYLTDVYGKISYSLGGNKILLSPNKTIVSLTDDTIKVIRFLVVGLFSWGDPSGTSEYDSAAAMVEVPFYGNKLISPLALGYADRPIADELFVSVRLMDCDYSITFRRFSNASYWQFSSISKDSGQTSNFKELALQIYQIGEQ